MEIITFSIFNDLIDKDIIRKTRLIEVPTRLFSACRRRKIVFEVAIGIILQRQIGSLKYLMAGSKSIVLEELKFLTNKKNV